MVTLHNINRFSFSQLCANDNGKTSGSGFSGVLAITVGVLCFMMGVIDKMFISHTTDIMTNAAWLVTAGSTLLGVRKYVTTKNPDPNALVDTTPDPPAPADPAPVVVTTTTTTDVTATVTPDKGTTVVDNPDS